MAALSNIQSSVPKHQDGRWNGNNGRYEKNQKSFHPPTRKNQSLLAHPLELNQRWITRIISFLALVVYYLHTVANTILIDSQVAFNATATANGRNLSSGSSNMNAKTNHIHFVPNIDEQETSNGNVNATTTAKANNVRISFSLHDPTKVPFKSLYAPASKGCHIGSLRQYSHGGERTGVHPPSLMLGGTLESHRDNPTHIDFECIGGRVLDFTTTITTNLKILNVGDSISIQMAQALDEMMGAPELNSRQLLWESWPGGDGGTLVAPTRGGGINGAWRLTGLLSQERQGLHQMSATRDRHAQGLGGGAGGWNYHRVYPFLRHVYQYNGENIKVERIDAVIFRVQHGWMDISEITRERIIEAAEMAKKVLDVSTIIFITVPFTNNVNTIEIMEGVRKINDMIWDVARTWHTTRKTQEHHDTTILVMDYATFSQHLIWTNARYMGYNVTAPLLHHGDYDKQQEIFATEGPTFLLERLNTKVWPPSIPQVCSKQPTKASEGMYCDRNYLFADGIHFCTETLSARIGASVACLLGCVFNRRDDDVAAQGGVVETNDDGKEAPENREVQIRDCERQCNEQFMSVMGVRESWVRSSMNLASFSG